MKTSLMSFALALVLSVTAFAMDNIDDTKKTSSATITTTNRAAVYNLVYTSAKAGLVTVSIKNQDGLVVMQEEIESDKKGFIRPYNFTAMPAGSYTLVVKDAAGKSELSLTYAHTVLSPVRKAEIKSLESNKYQLRLIGSSAESIEVTIYNQFDLPVYTETLTQKGSFIRTYDLSKMKSAKNRFEVKANGKIINQIEL
ncbi:hypothetical protein QNI19_27025 [Cytophagaceae bacterium DM2B3-1]|uniref:Por secretion system C-terminal sorting domain-containing protein n=1 Tax=Xanthocytophaga flava TaxID=3048013 RepID=A0ABT7CSD4_9BACT|nr:hypothetical protein [Xanthocytophaga flavus]MDJ1471535.1 hypothetical protein [Xanthocytophaga flavus]MDJ1496615.1 hypothetical protein [Xanthocytophaga flavus]